jgi:hypothetical protein
MMKISASLALFLYLLIRQVFSSAPEEKVEALPRSLKSPGRLTEERDLLLGAAALQAQGGDGQTADVTGHGPDLDLSPGQEIGAAGTHNCLIEKSMNILTYICIVENTTTEAAGQEEEAGVEAEVRTIATDSI